MTNFLLRLFVKDPTGPQGRAAVGRLSGLVGIVCNLLLFALKLVVGTLSGSLSITADAMNNLSDASSAIITLLGFKLSEKPADQDHPYGHARFEYLSGLGVSIMIILIGFELAKSSLEKIFHPTAVAISVPMVLVLVGSIAVKLWLSLFNTKLGQQIDSTTLAATAADSRNDAISTAAVLLAALVELVTRWRIDGAMGLLVAAFILVSGAGMAKDTISPLLGENASPELQKLILDIVRSNPKILGYHDLMVHDYGPGQRFATLHVEMDSREDPLECHEIIDDLERACQRCHGVHLTIHYDPVVVGDPETDALRSRVKALVEGYDPRLTIHDFRMVKSKGHVNLIFDVVAPDDLISQSRQIQQRVETELNRDSSCTYYTVITFDPAAFNEVP